MTTFPYDRAALRPTVVHIGPGGFHRAHQAAYADAVLRTGSTTGAICGISLRSPSVRDALRPSGFAYHIVELAPDRSPTVRPIGALLGIDVATEDIEAALADLVDPAVRVVTTTVTEHGYCAVRPGGELDLTRTEITHDLACPTRPRSLPGLLLEGLRRRRAEGTAPFTVACCDNLPGNGAATARVVRDLAEAHDPALAEWVRGNVAFPSSMVDRMVPSPTPADAHLARDLGIDGAATVVTEPFTQWVLEDVFPHGRPPWERVGVELVSDVTGPERTKLRVLNAAHSALAYWGTLAGHRHVWEAATDPVLRAAVWDLLECEVLPTLTTPPGWNLTAYATQVLDRFANSALPYTIAKVAGDGSQKLPVRLVPTVLAQLERGHSVPRCAQVLAAWAACMGGPRSTEFAIDDAGLAAMPPNPRSRRVGRSGSADDVVDALTSLPGFFDTTPSHRRFVASVAREARALWRGDVRETLRRPVHPPARDPRRGDHP